MKNKAEYIQFVLVMQLVITNGQKVLVIGTDSGISFKISNCGSKILIIKTKQTDKYCLYLRMIY